MAQGYFRIEGLSMIGMLLTIGIFAVAISVIIVGVILDFCGFYKRMEKFEQIYLDNSEYDFGHDVTYDSKEEKQ